VKEFLSREGHTFEAKNIEEDDVAYEELLALGARAVPTTVIDKEVVTGYDQGRLRAALAAGGGGSAPGR
jgi:glutaredoxin